MLLQLILFAGCLSSCAAQTTYVPFSTTDTTTMDFTPLSQPLKPTAVLPGPHSANIVAILRATVQSAHELNEATFTSVLNQLHAIIQQLDPDVKFTLTLKNISRPTEQATSTDVQNTSVHPGRNLDVETRRFNRP